MFVVSNKELVISTKKTTPYGMELTIYRKSIACLGIFIRCDFHLRLNFRRPPPVPDSVVWLSRLAMLARDPSFHAAVILMHSGMGAMRMLAGNLSSSEL